MFEDLCHSRGKLQPVLSSGMRQKVNERSEIIYSNTLKHIFDVIDAEGTMRVNDIQCNVAEFS